MNDKAKALLDAHVNFILQRVKGDELNDIIREEASFIWEHLDSVRLKDVASAQEVLDFQKRNFEHRTKAADPVKIYIKELRQAIYDHLAKSDHTAADIIQKSTYDELVKEVSELHDVRRELIKGAISNPLYGQVIGNILADGIKSFTSEEGVAGKIPGASSFFKMGSGLLGGLQDSIDKSVRKFISENIGKLTRQSEGFVQDLMNDAKVRELGQSLWDSTSRKPIKKMVARVRVDEFDGFEPVVEKLANEVVRSELATELNELVINHFFEEHGKKSLQELLLGMEISREDVERESVELFGRILRQALEDGSLKKRVKKHLKDFYKSDEVAAIL